MNQDERSGDRLAAAARHLEGWLRPVFTGLAVLAALAGSSIVVLIGVSVTMRHLANAPLHITEELVGLLMTAAFFLAMPLVTIRAEHVRVSIVVANLSAGGRRWMGLAAGGFGVAFCLWFFWLCLPWFDFAFARNLKTEVARLLLYPWMVLVPLSMLLTAIAFAIRALAGQPIERSG